MKQCPFCGSSDVGYGYPEHPKGNVLVTISCSQCFARGPAIPYLNISRDDDDEAERLWDTRSNAKSKPARAPDELAN